MIRTDSRCPYPRVVVRLAFTSGTIDVRPLAIFLSIMSGSASGRESRGLPSRASEVGAEPCRHQHAASDRRPRVHLEKIVRSVTPRLGHRGLFPPR